MALLGGDTMGLTLRRLGRLMTVGFRGPRSRPMKRLVIVQWLIAATLLLIWFQFNGGLLPRFLQSSDDGNVRLNDVNPLDYFTLAQHDAALITWSRGVNSRDGLLQATTGDAMMIVADVNVDGAVAVMSGSPVVPSAMTLDTWLDIVKHCKKGIKLQFHSVQAVEVALRKLRQMQNSLHMPVQLSATVIGQESEHTSVGPPLLAADQVLRLCTTQFPQSTLALGWAQGAEPAAGERYNWTDVKLMYDLIERWQVKQPVTLVAHVRQARHSTTQLKWLMEMTGASLTVYTGQSPPADSTSVLDLLYMRHRFPIHSVYYDIPQTLRTEFLSDKEEGRVGQEVAADVEKAFVYDQWHVVKSRDGETIYVGTESVLMQSGLLLTKAEYSASSSHSVTIEGRVEFLYLPTQDDLGQKPLINDESDRESDVGLAVFLRATQSSRPDSITGIRCFIGLSGTLKIETRGVPGADAQVTAAIPGLAPCLVFKIIDSGDEKISLNVTRPKSCDDMTTINFSNGLSLPMQGVATEASYIAIRQSPIAGKLNLAFTAVDQFTIRSHGSA